MPAHATDRWLLSAVCLAVIWSATCLARGYATSPAAGTDLNGTWQLDAAASDDPRKILATRIQQRMQQAQEHRGPPPEARGPPPGGPSRGTVEGSVDQPMPPSPTAMRRAFQRQLDEFLEQVEMPEQMTIAHSADRFTISGSTPGGSNWSTQYQAGSKVVVSVPEGVADRQAGWKGKAFMISTRAVEGMTKVDRFELDKDGRLLVYTETSGEDVPHLAIKRVYNRVTSAGDAAKQLSR